MSYFKKIRIVLATLALAVVMISVPLSAQRKGDAELDQSAAQSGKWMMSMPEMMVKMHHLVDETSQMRNSLDGNSQSTGSMHGMMMGGECMMSVCNGLDRLAQALNGMMDELEVMMSDQKMMQNEEYKAHMQQMKKNMTSMMHDLESMVGGVKSVAKTAQK